MSDVVLMHVNMYGCAEQGLNMARSAFFKLALVAAAVLPIAGVAAQVRLALAAPPLCAIEIVHVPQGFAGIQTHVRPAAQRRYCDHPQPSVRHEISVLLMLGCSVLNPKCFLLHTGRHSQQQLPQPHPARPDRCE